MIGATVQQKIWRGNGKAAARIGFPCTVYRSASMLNPLVSGNVIASNFMASFTPTPEYMKYNKPHMPDWMGMFDATTLQNGDWIVGTYGTFYLADIQGILPLPSIKCQIQASIVRPGYSVSGPAEQTEAAIASSFPLYSFKLHQGGHSPAGFPEATESKSAIPGRIFYANNHTVGAIKKNDVVIDEVGDRYAVDSATLTSFGFVLLTHLEKP